ncbi:hypothetical protein KZZ52_19895 [Dactylosporangium sp. AC04546]|uniref:hypothetical protein n=1 Tax=Dactylosporangium sp. AC04546 TaxID=2862460 RepID=UPI001EDD93D1|nr:hypothetical protein [Dactylosporangium sp. AC04546]WVK87561.1 hypothetical protein KZZ52_19895 [Dactylosporangium sp. AC04546]
MDLTTALIGLAVVVYLLVRRFTGEPIDARRLVLLPLGLTVWGAVELGRHASGVHLLDAVILGAGALAGLAGGAARGLTVRVFIRSGHPWYRYTPLTMVVWLVLIAVRLGESAAAHALGADRSAQSAGLLLLIGLSLLGEAAVVGVKALALTQGRQRVAR